MKHSTVLVTGIMSVAIATVVAQSGEQFAPGARPLEIEAGTMGSRIADRVATRAEFRSADGSGNNLDDPLLNAAGTQLMRRMSVGYADGVWQMAAPQEPAPREISNAVVAQSASIVNNRRASDFLLGNGDSSSTTTWTSPNHRRPTVRRSTSRCRPTMNFSIRTIPARR